MSAQNILASNGKIEPQFIDGAALGFVSNPMTADLECANYHINNAGRVNTTEINADNLSLLPGSGLTAIQLHDNIQGNNNYISGMYAPPFGTSAIVCAGTDTFLIEDTAFTPLLAVANTGLVLGGGGTATTVPVQAPTVVPSSDSSTKVATTAFVQSVVSALPAPTTPALSTVLTAGNSAGSTDINMNGNDILNCASITATGDLVLNPVGSIDANGKTLNMTAGEIHNCPLIHSQNNTNITIEGKGTGDVILKTANVDRITVADSGAITFQGGMSYNNATNALTATTFSGALSGNATSATNLAGGLGGSIPYQSAVNTTALLANGTAGQVLTSAGTTLAPTWTTISSGSAPSYYANFNVNKKGYNKKQRFILPSSKNITSANVVAKVDGDTTLTQLYTFGDYVASRMIVGGAGIRYSGSGNLNTWTATTSPFSVSCNAVFWTGTRWIAGGEGAVNTLAYSNDGITWVGLGNSIFTTKGLCFCSNNAGRILAGGQSSSGVGNTMAYSDDGGLTWTGLGFTTFYFFCNSIAFDGSTWVAGGQSGASTPSIANSLYYGYTGIEVPMYATSNGFGSTAVNSVIWNGSYWLACGGAILQVARASFTSWTTWGSFGTNYINRCLCWNGEMFVMGSYNGVQTGGWYSYNGYNWTAFPANASVSLTTGLTSIIWDGGKFIATADNGVYLSYNGIDWDISVAGVGYCLATNNFKRPNRMLVSAGSPNAVITVVGGTLTTSDLEIVESQFYTNSGFSNFSVRID